MRNASRPSGPGRPDKEQRDAVETREQLDEVELGEAAEGGDAQAHDPTRSARQAERDAHTGGDRSRGDRDRGR